MAALAGWPSRRGWRLIPEIARVLTATRANASLLLQVATVILLIFLTTQPGVANAPPAPIATVCKSAPNNLNADTDCDQLIADHLYAIEPAIVAQNRGLGQSFTDVTNAVDNLRDDLSADLHTLHTDLTTLDRHFAQLDFSLTISRMR